MKTRKPQKNNWFLNTFLKSFKEGETRISEKQFAIFEKYLIEDTNPINISTVFYGYIKDYKITAIEQYLYGNRVARFVYIIKDTNANDEMFKNWRVDL